MKGDAGAAQEMMKSSSAEQPQLPVPEDMPLAAQPQGPRLGKKSYTLHAQGLRGGPGKSVIEVQLEKCIQIKKVETGMPLNGESSRCSWKTQPLSAAWEETLRNSVLSK